MTKPAIGSLVKILRDGTHGLVTNWGSDDRIAVTVALNQNGKVGVGWYHEDTYEVLFEAPCHPPKFTLGQEVIASVNDGEWSGKVVQHLDDGYLVSLIVKFAEDELKPFVIVNPGH